MFFNCSCSSDGGAIYFTSTNSYLRMICANKCSCGTSSWCHFGRLQASDANYGEFLSLSSCPSTYSGHNSVRFVNGKQSITKVNSSMNKGLQTSGICIESPSSFINSFCTYSNNKVSDCLCLNIQQVTGIISYSIIIGNNSPNIGIIEISGGSPKMDYCVFDMNDNTLVSINSGSLIISHSFISHAGKFSTSTSISTGNNNSFIQRQTYQIQFFNSYYCNADIPLLTHLSTNEQTPCDSPNPTIEMTECESPLLTPYRSYGDHSPHQTLFPEHSPHQTLFPEHTPHQTFFPIHTPYDTHHPERTNQRSFQSDFIERTTISNENQNNSVDENKSNTIFMYSTVILLVLILLAISYFIGSQRSKKDKDYSSSSLEITHHQEGNNKKENTNENKRETNRNDHEDHVSSPYVF